MSIRIYVVIFISLHCYGAVAGVACPWTNNDMQINCTAGYYSTGLQRTCTRCPAGSECPDTDDDANIAECQAGFYRLADLSNVNHIY